MLKKKIAIIAATLVCFGIMPPAAKAVQWNNQEFSASCPLGGSMGQCGEKCGFFTSTGCNGSNNGTCGPCPNGKECRFNYPNRSDGPFCDEAINSSNNTFNGGQCSGHACMGGFSDCQAGYYCYGEGFSGTSYKVICPKGSYCPSGSSSPTSCATNYTTAGTGSTSSSACYYVPPTSCTNGQYLNAGSCTQCPTLSGVTPVKAGEQICYQSNTTTLSSCRTLMCNYDLGDPWDLMTDSTGTFRWQDGGCNWS